MREGGLSIHDALQLFHLIVFYQNLKVGTKLYLHIYILYISYILKVMYKYNLKGDGYVVKKK